MSDREAFLRAIIASPDDDLPRLVFADWLDEHGEPERAEFIRLQIRNARFRPPVRGEECTEVSASWCPNCGGCSCRDRAERMDDPGCPLHDPDSPHAVSLDDHRRRERELLGRIPVPWLPPPLLEMMEDVRPTGDGSFAARTRCSYSWRRGFVAEVALSWPDWLAHHAAILESCPIRNAKGGLVRLATWPDAGGSHPPPRPEWRDRELTAGWLAVQWPGVRFELPPAERPRFDEVLDWLRSHAREAGLPEGREWRHLPNQGSERRPEMEIICECQRRDRPAPGLLSFAEEMARPLRVMVMDRLAIRVRNVDHFLFAGPCPDCGVILYTSPRPRPQSLEELLEAARLANEIAVRQRWINVWPPADPQL